MEVGAVKQAFNNEIILLKKNLNQAKIQTIHKLTRKSKQLLEKKAPEKSKEKLKRKAELAVKEVLIIKKIKARDIGRFIVTHKEDLKKYLNRPQVDKDRVCARLLLHKSLQEKYNLIRSRFSNVPIKDLFMSRQERLKLKKEAKEKQKNKKKSKIDKVVNAEGDWNVENVAEVDDKNIVLGDDDNSEGNLTDRDDMSEDSNIMSDDESQLSTNKSIQSSDIDSDASSHKDNEKINSNAGSDDENHDGEISDDDNEDNVMGKTVGRFVKLNTAPEIKEVEIKSEVDVIKSTDELPHNTISRNTEKKQLNRKELKTNLNKKVKDVHKNRNLNEKIQQKKFKKKAEDSIVTENKVVDPFFITSSGGHYMSLAEPRQPDEVKEIHKQGNRKMRRAVMFGHEIKFKPRNSDFNNDFRNKNDRYENDKGKTYKSGFNDRKDGFKNRGDGFNKNIDTNKDAGFNGQSNYHNRSDFNSKRKFNNNDSKFLNTDNFKSKDEKLHPSWEAKKRQSGILPFQGKKIVFNES